MASFPVRCVVLLLLLVSLAPIPAVGQVDPPGSLRLRPGDGVRLEVRDEPQLAGEYLVDERGQVLLPLVGLVEVAGRDFEAVRRAVVADFRGELAHEDVRLTPLIRIAVLGEVRQPGLYPVDPTYSLADVLAGAGGLGPEADRDRVELVRDGRVVRSVSEADAVALGEALRSGDQVVVARRSWFSQNSQAVLGAGISILVALTTALLVR